MKFLKKSLVQNYSESFWKDGLHLNNYNHIELIKINIELVASQLYTKIIKIYLYSYTISHVYLKLERHCFLLYDHACMCYFSLLSILWKCRLAPCITWTTNLIIPSICWYILCVLLPLPRLPSPHYYRFSRPIFYFRHSNSLRSI